MTLAKRTEISAILGEEFEKFMDALGVREAFEDSRYKCHYCHQVVDSTNVLLVFPKRDRQVAFICTRAECAFAFANSSDREDQPTHVEPE